VRVLMLGSLSVLVGSRILEEGAWRLRKAANLVKILALTPGHRMHRERVMDVLWPDLASQATSNNLRAVIHAARRTLDPDASAASRYLTLPDDQVALYPEEQLWVHVKACFEGAAAADRRSQDPAAYRAAIELYAGELLSEDRYEEWAEEHRRRLREVHLSLLVGFGLFDAGTGDNYLGGAASASSKIIQSGDPVKFNAGELAVQIVRPS
jgi:DNA-binding SARP family transcriptional activator